MSSDSPRDSPRYNLEHLEDLPMALRQLEECLEKSNENVSELKESLKYVLEREAALRSEHQALKYKLESREKLWAGKEAAMVAAFNRKLSVIPSLEDKIGNVERQLTAERERVMNLNSEIEEIHSRAQTDRSASSKLKEDCIKYQSTVERLHQAMKQLNEEAIVWRGKVAKLEEELQLKADEEFTLKAQLDNETRKNERLDGKVQSKEKEISELRKQLKMQEGALSTLKTESQKVSQKNTELLTALEQVGKDVEEVRVQSLASSDESKRLRAELEKERKNSEDKETQLALLTSQLSALEEEFGGKIVRLQAEQDEAKRQHRAKDEDTYRQVQELEMACNEMSRKHRDVLQQLEDTQTQLRLSQSDLLSAKAALLKSQDSISSLEKKRLESNHAALEVSKMRGEIDLWKASLLELVCLNRPRVEDILRSLLGVAPERSRLPVDRHQAEHISMVTGKIREVIQSESPIRESPGRMLEELTVKYRKEMAERKRLLRILQDLRGNIRVMCRIRPLLRSEKEDCVQVMDMCQVKVVSEKRETWFEFDRAFLQWDSQEVVFYEVADMVEGVLDGYSACIMAYGQTGSGKTFTMEGSLDNLGVNYRALKLLFDIVEDRRETHEYELSITILEVYNEQIRNLLDRSQARLDLREDSSGQVRIPGLANLPIGTYADVVEAMEQGKANRSVGATNVNEYSSRSHSIVTINVECQNEGKVFSSKLNLIDLAGSERVWKSEAEGQRMVEACNINQSLAALGKVLSALASKQNHIPYRDSKLTHLLKDSLAGDAKTMVIVTISPAITESAETLSSLSFGTRVACVEKGKAKPGRDSRRNRSTSRSRRSGSPALKLDVTPNQYTQAGNGILIPKLSLK